MKMLKCDNASRKLCSSSDKVERLAPRDHIYSSSTIFLKNENKDLASTTLRLWRGVKENKVEYTKIVMQSVNESKEAKPSK